MTCPDGSSPAAQDQSACESAGKLWSPDGSASECGRCAVACDKFVLMRLCFATMERGRHQLANVPVPCPYAFVNM